MHRLTLTALLALLTLPALAGDDFGIWTGIAAEKRLSTRWSLGAEVEMRSEQNLHSLARWSAGLDAGYKLLPWLKAGAGYAFIHQRNPQEQTLRYNKRGEVNGVNVDHGFWRQKHRAFGQLQASARLGRLTLSLRERYQFTHYMPADALRDKLRSPLQPGYTGPSYQAAGREFASLTTETDRKHHKNKQYLRSRLQLEYNIRHCPLTPSLAYEVSNDLVHDFSLDKHRLSAELDWKVSKRHILSAGYTWQTGGDDDDEADLHALCLGYKFKF